MASRSVAVEGSWYRSRWTLIGGAIVLLAAAIALAAPYLFNVDHYRPLIDAYLERTTGHEVTIKSLRLHVLPSIRVQAADVRVKNPQDFPAGDAAVIGSIDLGIALRPLLARRLEVTRIALNDVHVNVLHNAAGRSNFGGPPAAETDEPTPARAGAPRAAVTLGRVGAVTLTNASIAFGSALKVTGLRASMNAVDLRSDSWTQQLAISASLAGAGVVAAQLAKPLRITAGDLRIKPTGAQATFTAALEATRADGTITVSSYNPLAVRFGLTVPELNVNTLATAIGGPAAAGGAGTGTGTGSKHLLAGGTVKVAKLVAAPVTVSNVNAAVRIYTTGVEVPAFSLSGYGGTASGSGTISTSARAMPATITARVAGLNLAQVLGALGVGAGKLGGTLQANVKLSASLATDVRKTLAGSGTFTIGRLTAKPLAFSRATGSVKVTPGAVQFQSFSVAGYGGTAWGSGVVAFGRGGVPASVAARVQGVNLAQLLGAVSPGAGKITGTLRATARLSAALGGDVRRSLAGAGTFAVTNGSFPGMEMQISLAKLAKAFQIDVEGGTTKFSLFSGTLRIANQRITGSNLALDAVGFVGNAQGIMGFDGTLNFTGTGHLAARRSAAPPPRNLLQRIERGIAGTVARGLQGVRVPFTLKGTLASPQFTLAGTVAVTEQPPKRLQQPVEGAD